MYVHFISLLWNVSEGELAKKNNPDFSLSKFALGLLL